MHPLDRLCLQLLRDQGQEWNQPARLLFVMRASLGDLVARPIGLPERLRSQSPETQMRMLSVALHQVVEETGLPLDHNICGLITFYEGWKAPEELTTELINRIKAGGSLPPLNEVPGSSRAHLALGRTFDHHTTLAFMDEGTTGPELDEGVERLAGGICDALTHATNDLRALCAHTTQEMT